MNIMTHHEPETIESNVEYVQLSAIPQTPLHQTIQVSTDLHLQGKPKQQKIYLKTET